MAELIDTVLTVAWALAAWVVFGATVAAILVTAAAVTGAWAVRGAWRSVSRFLGSRKALSAPVSAEQPSGGSGPATTPERRSGRRAPSWACTQPIDYEEAA